MSDNEPPSSSPTFDNAVTTLSATLPAHTPFSLTPSHVLVAWSGVLTLALHPLPPAALSLKSEVESALQSSPIPPSRESPGSKWPKVTLGALATDDPLTGEDLAALESIANAHRESLVGLGGDVSVLSIVNFGPRSLDRSSCTIHTETLSSSKPPVSVGEEIVEEHRAFVQSVWDEAEGGEAYLPLVQKGGNRGPHYTDPVEGVTLVAYLGDTTWGEELQAALAAFRNQVDSVLPGKYVWLPPDAYHVTLRGIAG